MNLSDKNYPQILVVDDDPVTRELLRRILETDGYQVDTAESGEEAQKRLEKHAYPLILSDINMSGLDGLNLLASVKQSGYDSVVILMTGFGSLETAMEAIHRGAFDYVSKPVKPSELKSLIARAFKHWEVEHDKKGAVESEPSEALSKTLIGNSPSMVLVYRMIARAAISHSNVLVLGQSGTGKELVARAIHENSPLRNQPFLTVNCSALAETLLESELFGHAKGAFTGAISAKRGLFEVADGGTIFLDEIGDISPGLQVKLLRVVQEGEFKPVGTNDTRKVNVRVIAATHRDLEAYVREGRFREDLFYRLKVILIEIPPLKERMEDIPVLVEHFLRKHAPKVRIQRKPVVSHEAMERLMQYPWPGNVRELEHAIERAIAMANSSVLYPEDFPKGITEFGSLPQASPESGELVSEPPPARSLEEMERVHIARVLREVSFNRSRAAQVLGIDRATLYRKAQRYGIELDEEKVARS